MAYIIIYPSGDRSQLNVVWASDYEYDEYDRASRKDFVHEKDAREYARQLAQEHGKTLKGDPDFLD